MDYLTSGNACLKEGASFIAWGVFFTSLGWVLLGFLLGKCGDINRLLSKVKFFRKTIVRGIIVVMLLVCVFALIRHGLKKTGEGNTSMTEGWNLLRVHSQRQNLVRAVVQEWLINEGKMNARPLTGQACDKASFVVYTYPRFRASALNAVLSSGLWNYGEPNESRFLTAVSSYEITIAFANQCCDSINTTLSRNISNEQRIAKAIEQQTMNLNSPWYSDLKVKHEELRKLLATEYRWAMLEQIDPNTRKALLESEKVQTQNQPSIPDKH
jgi:hypothetical protein